MHIVTHTASYSTPPAYTGILSIVNGTFTGHLSELLVGYATTYRGNGYGMLDLGSSDVQIGDTPDCVKVARLIVAGGKSSNPYHTGGMNTTVRFPASITNVTVGELQVGVGGGAYSGGGGSKGNLEFAAGSQLRALTVTNKFWMGAYHAGYGRIKGLPTTPWDLTLGMSPQRISMIVGHKNHEGAYNLSTLTEADFVPTNATVSAYLSSLVVGVCSNTSSWGPVFGEVNLEHSTLVDLDISGDTVIGYSSHTYAGLAQGYLRLPSGSARTGNLIVGSDNDAARSYGQLDLNGTEFMVTNQCTIYHVGYVTNTLAGTAGGIDIVSTDTNNFVIQAGGHMHLTFDSDPADPMGAYWGLRMAGDQQEHFQWLHDQGRLTWDTSALSPNALTRFGIHHSGMEDVTIVGLRATQGTLILLQ